jgi:hypothetical protein
MIGTQCEEIMGTLWKGAMTSRLRVVIAWLFLLISGWLIFPTGVQAGWEWQNRLSTGHDLNAIWVSAADDVFTVGNGGTILDYNGSTWTTMPSGTTVGLCRVWGNAANNVFCPCAGFSPMVGPDLWLKRFRSLERRHGI